MKESNTNKTFRDNLLGALLPTLERHGFKIWKPAVKDCVPVVYLRRTDGMRRDLFEIQFDKYNRNRCLVNMASIEGQVVQTMHEGVIAAEEITTAHLRDGCRVCGGFLSDAFRPSLITRIFSNRRSGEKVAHLIATRMGEAEEWFRFKRVGRNLRVFRL